MRLSQSTVLTHLIVPVYVLTSYNNACRVIRVRAEWIECRLNRNASLQRFLVKAQMSYESLFVPKPNDYSVIRLTRLIESNISVTS